LILTYLKALFYDSFGSIPFGMLKLDAVGAVVFVIVTDMFCFVILILLIFSKDTLDVMPIARFID